MSGELVVTLERELEKSSRRLANVITKLALPQIDRSRGDRRFYDTHLYLNPSDMRVVELLQLVELHSNLLVRYETALRDLPAVPTVGGRT